MKSIIKTLSSTLLALVTLLFLIPSAYANRNALVLGDVIYDGNACPKGSVDISLSSANLINIQFKKLKVQNKGRNQFNHHKTCSLRVPINVAKGMSISLKSASYKGDIVLAKNNLARMMTVFNFAGKYSDKYVVDFNGPETKRYFLQDQLSALANIWSGCGQNTMLSVVISARLKGNNNAHSMAGSNSSIMMRLKSRNCQR
ncbi:MAG: DUF4360 domain-containing protein [Thiotrichaceae bacterium]|nr:DUF4360 domain-containing protein [Thiotrichaceae bacterium]